MSKSSIFIIKYIIYINIEILYKIVKYLYNEKPTLIPYIDLRFVGKPKLVKNNYDLLKKYVDITLSKLPDNKVYLIVSAADGSMQAKYFSPKIGQIFDNKDELKDFLIKRGGKRNHYLFFNSVQEAKNCKVLWKDHY